MEKCMCAGCGAEFVKTRPNRRYCSRKCALKFSNKAWDARRKEMMMDCPHNHEVVCYERKCGSCGWNPQVARVRSERLKYKIQEAML